MQQIPCSREPEIQLQPEKKLVGRHLRMSLAENKTFALWSSFMPLRKTISNAVNSNLYSMQVYDADYDFVNFNPNAQFQKWAAVEVANFNFIPEGMEAFTLAAGLYAVFTHRGPASLGAQTFQYIFGTWLPASVYDIDARPHFELLGEKYKNDHPDSEEEIWVPVRPK